LPDAEAGARTIETSCVKWDVWVARGARRVSHLGWRFGRGDHNRDEMTRESTCDARVAIYEEAAVIAAGELAAPITLE
jgi:hypothetical protein